MIKIYTLAHPETCEVRYIGITSGTLEHRLAQHLCDKKSSKRVSWIKKLKNQNLKPIIELVDIVTEENWQNEEIFYIKYFKYLGFNLVNMTEGGDRVQMTQEIKDKISSKLKGLKKSEECKAKIRKANLEGRCGTRGRKLSEEHKFKISEANTGKKHSQERILANIARADKKKLKQLTLKGDVIKIWNSISECCKENNYSKGNIIKVCKNHIRKDGSKCLTAYNYKWEYEKE